MKYGVGAAVTYVKIDIDKATREELANEVHRLDVIIKRWSSSWHAIVSANAKAWVDEVDELKARIAMLEGLL